MSFKQLLTPAVQEYIIAHTNSDVSALALQKKPFYTIDFPLILNQIVARKKAKLKLPTWYNSKSIIYPSKIAVEQTSSEQTAHYKASLVTGTSLLDASGGFGVDSYYFSKQVNTVYHCEINSELSAIAKHNFKVLNAKNIICLQGDSTSIIKAKNEKYSCIYLDPSRRNIKKGKVFMLADCEPNVTTLLDFYFLHTTTLLIKTAPILDITAAYNELEHVKEIHIVALHNEVKEILWVLEKNYSKSPLLIACNIEKEATFKTTFDYSETAQATYAMPKTYLYEPNAALLKTGKFDTISSLYILDKLHQHSHLYTSEKKIAFPGRCFKIVHWFVLNKKNAKQYLQHQKLNVSTRNFPLKPDAIKSKYTISDGGTIYAFFTTNIKSEKIVVFCEKI